MRQYLNWKTYLAIIALFIVSASLFYTSRLAGELAIEEKKKVEEIADALKILSDPNNTKDLETAVAINTMAQNKNIPLIIADEKDNIKDKINIDSSSSLGTPNFAQQQLKKYKSLHDPIEVDYGTGKDYVYYGESYLLTQLRYFPYVQLAIIVLFLTVVLLALTEMQKDLDRLKLVADRFSKVGSAPKLEEENLILRLENIVEYMQKRSPKKVHISLRNTTPEVPVNISGPLFDWVMENLIRNALDAMGGEGNISISVTNQPQQVFIDVQDTGKGIPAHQVKDVFRPGFTTKKRGWGLGLSLARRIIAKYHHGSIFVRNSEVGKGTTFRIILRR
jgi:chemotaxis protein histidine kinase CheA